MDEGGLKIFFCFGPTMEQATIKQLFGEEQVLWRLTNLLQVGYQTGIRLNGVCTLGLKNRRISNIWLLLDVRL